MRPFGCFLTILNTLDSLGKFDRKFDEGYLLGYSTSSKAFRVYNKRTKRVEENLHINFLEDQPNVAGTGPNWMFDLDFLTNSMNYIPVSVENQVNVDAGTQDSYVAGSSGKYKGPTQEYILLLLQPYRTRIPVKDVMPEDEQVLHDELEKMVTQELTAKAMDDVSRQAFEEEKKKITSQKKWLISTTWITPLFQSYSTLRIHKDLQKGQILGDPNIQQFNKEEDSKGFSSQQALVSYIHRQNITNHKDHQNCLFACFLSQEEPKTILQALQDESWDEAMQEELLQFKLQKVWVLVDLPYGKKEGLLICEVFAPVARIEAIRLFLAFASYMGFTVYQMDVKSAFLYDTIEEEVTATTPIESNKPLVKDEDGVDVDVHVYKSMIGSLMYLTTSRPEIMFVVCACARFQVTPKASHLNVVKRIFSYLKHQPKLGLWYPKDSPFELEAFSDSDYRGASLDKKSTTGGCQFLCRRLIYWQCKKKTIVANSTTEAEYVAAANCCGKVLWIQNQMMDYGFNFMNSKIHIDNESTISVIKNPIAHSKTKHIEIRFHFIRDCYKKRLIKVIKIHTDHNVADLLTKGYDVTRFNFLVVSIGLLNL
ncbi:putative ribonuclease H-like domain-containing protein [Tanacetum coccineum]